MGQPAGEASLTRFEKGAESPKHRHPFEETLVFVEGGGEVFIDGKLHTVGKGDVVVLPGMTLHQFKATQDTMAIEIFHPKLTPEMIQSLKGSAG